MRAVGLNVTLLGVHTLQSVDRRLLRAIDFADVRRSDERGFYGEVLKVVAEAGIEPATQGFSVLCSTN
jgi:hypothetical protein